MSWISVFEWFARVSNERPGSTAIEWNHQRITYDELASQANRIAAQLISDPGWTKGSVVAVLTSAPPYVIASILGTLQCGGVFVPIDPAMPLKRIRQMLTEIAPAFILSDHATIAAEDDRLGVLTSVAQSIYIDDLDHTVMSASGQTLSALPDNDPDAVCYLYFTSGSVGKPKAIAGRLKAIDHFVRWEIDTFGIAADCRVSQLAHVGFDAYLRDVFVPLCSGGTICIPSDRSIIWQPEQLTEWVDSSKLTLLHCVPSMFRSLLNGPMRAGNFEHLRAVLMAGETLLPSDVDRWMSTYGNRIALVNLYGPSETTMVKLSHLVTEEDRHARTIPIGWPISGAAALIVDSSGQPCPPGIMGEIWIRTPFRSHGYYNHAELNDEMFIVNPFTNEPDDIIFKTGDYGRLRENGELDFSGRIDRQIKIRGARIELAEIEEVLHQCSFVRECAVLQCGSDSSPTLCAFLVLQKGEALESAVKHLSELLPPYMVPSEFLTVETLPRGFNGKVDSQALLELFKSRKPEPGNEGPFSETHGAVAAIWKEVLNVPEVRLHDNFFKLGGHSLAILHVISRLRHRMGVEISVAEMFLSPTLDSFTCRVQQALNDHDQQAEAKVVNQ